MSLASSVEGSAYFLATVWPAVLTGRLLADRRLAYLAGLSRLLAVAVLATAALIFAEVVPAALGILSRPTAVIASVALLVGSTRVRMRPSNRQPPEARSPPSGRWSIAIATLTLTCGLVYHVARLRNYAPHPPDFIDALGFHLPGVAAWIHSGTMWRVDQFEPGFATGQYPNNGDFLILSTVLPWRDLALVRLSMVPFFALTGLGTFALARELRASRAASVTFATSVTTLPYVSNFAFEGVPDGVTLSMFTIGVLFLVRHTHSQMMADLALAGLALGIAFGAKWYGVTSVAVTVVAWTALWLLRRRALRAVVHDGCMMLAAIALGGGIWLVRNLIESGNPLYPKAVSVAGLKLFTGSSRDVINRFGYSIAHYLDSPHLLAKYIYPGFTHALGISTALFPGGLLALVALRFTMRGDRRSRTALAMPLLVGATAIGILIIYVITPGTAYGPANLPSGGYPTLRWLMPAAILAAAATAFLAGQLGRAGIAVELAGLACVLDGIILGDQLGLRLVVEAVVGLAVTVTAAVLWRRWRFPQGSRLGPRLGTPLLGVALTLAAVGAIRIQQQGFDRTEYASADPVFAWIIDHAPSGHRVGVTGEAGLHGLAPVLPLAGPRLGNTVAYVGDRAVHSVEVPGSRASFRAELAQGHFDLLEIGLEHTGGTDRWVRSLGWRLVVASRQLALYAAPGR